MTLRVHYQFSMIGGKNEKEHDLVLRKILIRARERNIKFNREKIQFRVPQVKYIGEVVSGLGFSPVPESRKISAIHNMPTPSCKQDFQMILGMINEFLNRSYSPDTSFAFNLVTPTEVKLEISRIPNNKSHGLYSCATQILKCVSNVISNSLAEIINLSISTGVYSKKLKIAKIIPFFKTDDNTGPNNYTPISLLSNFNRIFQ